MNGIIVKDWDKVRIGDRNDRKKLFGALRHFMAQTQSPEFRGAAKHFATTGDFPTSILPLIDKYRLEKFPDDAWREVFDYRDMTGTQRNGFEILNVSNGLTFKAVQQGNKALVYGFSGTKTQVTFDMYGGGLNWSRTLWDDREYWTLEDNAVAFRNKYEDMVSQVHYDLIDAIGSGINIAWQAVTPAGVANTNENYEAIRDFNTLNKAAETIFLANKDKGYGISPATELIILAPIQLKARLSRALGVRNINISGNQPGVVYNFRILWTFKLSDPTKYYVILPKRKAKGAERMRLTIYDKFDEMSYSDTAVGWYRFGSAIGDTEQFARCATS